MKEVRAKLSGEDEQAFALLKERLGYCYNLYGEDAEAMKDAISIANQYLELLPLRLRDALKKRDMKLKKHKEGYRKRTFQSSSAIQVQLDAEKERQKREGLYD